MVDILTDAGVFLDLDPDAEFEITIENPLLQEDRIPVPFSTAISFLPTHTNKAVFGYLDAMMLEPTVKQLGASILVGGVQLYTGFLVYDSIDENGRINCTFSGKDPKTELGAKLWELSGLSWDQEDGYDYESFLAALKADRIPGVHLPPVVDGALTAEPGFRATPANYRPGRSQVNYNQKYRNQPDALDFSETVPAVELGAILGGIVSFSDIPGAAAFLQGVVVFGTNWMANRPSTKVPYFLYDAAATLPDITLADLLLDVCRMLCGAVFQDGGRFCLIPSASVLAAADLLDWDGRVSDMYRSSRENRIGYELDFEKENTASERNADTAASAATLCGILAAAREDYDVVKHSTLADLYSMKKADAVQINRQGSRQETIPVGTVLEILIDRCDRTGAKREAEGTEETKTIKVGLHLAKCVPVRRHWFPNNTNLASDTRMAAVLTLPAFGAERPKEAYIALYANGQACDKGVVIADPDNTSSADLTVGDSLTPEALFERYHQAYAAWLAKDRQLLSVDVNLSPIELASFRMWQAVRVRSRNFLVSKLSVRVAASADGVDVSADLISL